MWRTHDLMMALLLSGQVLFPPAASAGVPDQDDALMRQSRFEIPTAVWAGAAAQSPSVQKRSRAGGNLLRNTLIGAAIGATVMGGVWPAGDCGECGSERANAILHGAMYGALIGAAIRIHPSRRPSPSHSPRQMTIGAQLTKKVKAMNVAVRF